MIYVQEWLKERFSAPFVKAPTALVIHGERGSGKTIAAQLIAREIGVGRSFFMRSDELPRFSQIRDIEQRHLVIVDEAEERHLDHVKHLVSTRRIQVEPLGQEAFAASFNANFILTSSNVLLPLDNRRFIVASPMEVFATIAGMNRDHN